MSLSASALRAFGLRELKLMRFTGRRTPHLASAAIAILLLLAWHASSAQSVQLSPSQRAMLDSLPPSQRQQALQALETLNASQSRAAETKDDEVDDADVVSGDGIDADVLEALETEVFGPRSELVLTLTVRADFPAAGQAAIEDDPSLADLVGSNYFILDSRGVLELPGIADVSANRLTEESLERRLRAEPALSDFDVDVSVLSYAPIVAVANERFGQNVFSTASAGFDADAVGPVPPDFVLGPGDSVRIQLFGNVNTIVESEVGRDGSLSLPELGPINVTGLTFREFREDVRQRVAETIIGTQVSISVADVKKIQIFVLGDIVRPGSYSISSLSTISSALYASGGISEIGSFRGIELKRSGKTVSRLDLYDLLLRGDTSNDTRLLSGDVIFVPPVGPSVAVSGSVNRPAIYEMRGDTNIGQIVNIAGGFAPDAFRPGVRLERILDNGMKQVISVDGSTGGGRNTELQDGDRLFVPAALDEFENAVSLSGHVKRPGIYEFRPGMRVLDLLPSEELLKPQADLGYLLLKRVDSKTGAVSIESVDYLNALARPASSANLTLKARDELIAFGFEYNRQRVIDTIVEELQLQTRSGAPLKIVTVTGRVNAPGTYPLEPGMRISDLIRAGGALAQDAYVLSAEIARAEIVNEERRETTVLDIDLAAIIAGDPIADLVLQPYDTLRIDTIEDWYDFRSVSIDGEVRFPGNYRIRKGETLSSLLDRAGGFTAEAFPGGALFLRQSLREREQQQLDNLAERLEAQLVAQSLSEDTITGAPGESDIRSVLEQVRGIEATGRLVIDLTSASSPSLDLELREGDRLLIPKTSQSVTVIGETQQNISHVYDPKLDRRDYIQMSGGLTRRADRKLIFVVRANGEVVSDGRSRWFGRRGRTGIQPGDTIVVPLEVDRIRPLTLWSSVTQIFYQAAIAVAAINSFDNN